MRHAIDALNCNHDANVGVPAHSVNGGMVSSLLHILIVTPVIFALLRERELGPQNPAMAKL